MAKIVVLGCNSFSGARFVDHALESGHTVLGISRSKETSYFYPPFLRGNHDSHYEFHQLDLNRDLKRISELTREFRPQWFVDYASQSMVAESWLTPEHWFTTNVVSKVNLHDQLRKMPFIEKYVHVSTPEVYGSCSGNVTEDAPYNPSTPYAVSRAACDMSLQTFLKNYHFPVVFTRAANVMGPGQQLYRIIPKTILSIRLGKPLELHGGGTSVRSFIHIEDVSQATLTVIEKGALGEVYHIATRIQISIRKCVEMICDKMGVPFSESVVVAPERAGKDAAYLLDSSKIRALGWTDKVPLEQGIQETISWIDSYLGELRHEPSHYIHHP